jgi:hypothetical protein
MTRLLTFWMSKSGKSVMKIAKTLAIMACAALLSAGVIGSARHAYAQDASEIDQDAGAWSGPDAGTADESSRKIKVHPLDIKGCWSGDVADLAEGMGTATFDFDQNSNRKKLVKASKYDFEWPGMVYARGPMKGSVSSTGFQFNATVINAGEKCEISGSGTGDDTELTGTIEFGEACATIFEDVTFSITPGCP